MELEKIVEENDTKDSQAAGQADRRAQGCRPVTECGDEDASKNSGEEPKKLAEQDEGEKSGEKTSPPAPIGPGRHDILLL